MIAGLLFVLRRSIVSDSLRYWSWGMGSLAGALLSLLFAFQTDWADPIFFSAYVLGEYTFCFFLIAGARCFASDKTIEKKHYLLTAPVFALALILSLTLGQFNDFYALHCVVISLCFLASFLFLTTAGKQARSAPGQGVLKLSLLLLSLSFLHYFFLFGFKVEIFEGLLANGYLAFNPLGDLLFETMLGFGMVIALMQRVRQSIEQTNSRLSLALEKLESLAHTDPLTTAFNRHAFHNFLKKRGKNSESISGCVGVFDVDNLKPINDRWGHEVGDWTINSVAKAIRAKIRPDDLLFRWGGDEFFVVMVGMDVGMARGRMGAVDGILKETYVEFIGETLDIRVSAGFAEFAHVSELENAIRTADAEMYREKQARKSENDDPFFVPPQISDPMRNDLVM